MLAVLLPWSFELNFGAWSLQFPGEPLMALVSLVLFREIYQTGFNRIRTPFQASLLLRISLLWIAWMGVSALFSVNLVVSFKYWLVEAAHWWVFAVGIALYPALWLRILPYFGYSMLGVMAYTILHHSFYQFRADQALLAPMPFFPDHTLYAAVLAMLVFYQLPADKRFKSVTPWIFLLAGLFLSTCRAAILSVVAAGVVRVVYRFREKKRWLMAALVAGLLSMIWLFPLISDLLRRDVSFSERLNRWDCARAMWLQKPLLGYGPGTYQFAYFTFQKPENMTRISVSAPIEGRNPDTYGRGGGAHSEYWQAAAELGWPGLLLWLALVFLALYKGFSRPQYLMPTLGLLTFFLHALLNQFLHDARIAWLVWGGMMCLSAFSEPPGKNAAQDQQQ